MNYFGFMIALISGSVLIYALMTIISERRQDRGNLITPPPPMPFITPHSTEVTSRNLEKGYLFEKSIVRRFDKNFFHIIHWRSDKKVDGRFPESNGDPDLVFEYRHCDLKIRFAVECKWRAGFRSGLIEWTTARQLERYCAFQEKEGVPVFIVIGCGGTPEKPESTFVFSLDDVAPRTTHLSVKFLQKAEMKREEFFLNVKTMRFEYKYKNITR